MLSTATAKALRMVPANVRGATGVGSTVLEDAKALLERIKRGISGQSMFDSQVTDLRGAAKVLADGASDALKFGGQVTDDVAKDLKVVAREAWSLAMPPAVILLALYWLATKDG